MRLSSFILLLLLVSCSRLLQPDGIYFSDQQDCFVLDGKDGIIENNEDYTKDDLYLKQTNLKLKFRFVTHSPARWLFKKNVYKYYFKFHYKRSDSFMVSPASRLAKAYFKNRDSIVFKSKYSFADQTNTFTKIIYHSSRCFGYCHDLHLELDYSGNLKVTDNGNGLTDTAMNENYFGRVSSNDLERLKKILKYSQLKTLKWPKERKCYDEPDLTLIIYQPERRYYFHMNASCLPIVSRELRRYLTGLFHYETLRKVDTTFSYER